MLETSPHILHIFHEDGIWDVMFSKYFFYFGLPLEDQVALGAQTGIVRKVVTEREEESFIGETDEFAEAERVFDSVDTEPLRLEVISFVELAATSEGSIDNMVCTAPEMKGMCIGSVQRGTVPPS